MAKKKKLIIIWILIAIFALYFIINGFINISRDNSFNNIQTEIEDNFTNTNKTHWGHMPIIYKIENENECDFKVIDRINQAFSNIQSETEELLSFEKTNEIPDISIFCKPYHYEETYGVLGEASAFYILHGDAIFETHPNKEKLITNATINFYGVGLVCKTGYPALEVHEILHTFGFGHDYGINNIMREEVEETSANCKVEEIGDKHINCMKYIYSNGMIGNNCSGIDFTETEYEYVCKEGWYPVNETNLCCPEPNMIIVDGYCEEKD